MLVQRETTGGDDVAAMGHAERMEGGGAALHFTLPTGPV